MRTFELLLWLGTAAVGLWWAAGQTSRPRGFAPACAAVITILLLHAGVEGVRFHMIPTYLLAIGVSALGMRPSIVESGRRTVRTRFGLSAGLVAIVAIAGTLPAAFPVYAYDDPTGRYGIGTAVYTLPDGPKGRDLVVQMWYPTDVSHGTRTGVTPRPDLLETAYASFTGLPRPLLDNLRLVRTHAVANAPLASDRGTFPIVLFSHGPLSANRSQSIFQMEALASHGFVVAAIDHTGYASTTIFPDGRAVKPGPDAAWPVFVDAKSTSMLHTWVSDVRFVIDRLEALNIVDPAGLLTHRLDLSHVGYVGASFGGSVVVQALLDEPRIKAGIAEDGKPYFAEETPRELRRPLMYMQSTTPYIPVSDTQLGAWGLDLAGFKRAEQDHYLRLSRLFAQTSSPIYNLYLRRTNHVTFSDLYLIVRLPDFQLMDIRRAHRIINAYSVAFFERYLNGSAEPLVDGTTPSPYAEVTATSRNVPPSAEDARLRSSR
jgi:predicted dienelactone hydrolase